MTEVASTTAWSAALTALARTGDRLASEMQTLSQPLQASEVYTSLLGALMDGYLNQIAVSPDKPAFIPCTGYYQRLGSPNPDTVYRRAPIDPAGTYLLTGKRGGARDATLMAFTRAMAGARLYDLSQVARNADGHFEVMLSARRPDDHDGDWWELTPDTESLWLREVSDRWGEDQPVQIAIVRLDAADARCASPAQFDQRLKELAQRVERTIEYGIRHVNELAQQGVSNRLKSVDYGSAGAMPLQFYHEGLFALEPGECLLVECRMPADATYFSWSLTDSMLVTLDWMNAATSLNPAQAARDGDGVMRVVISPEDPGVPNWMETLGRRAGVMQFRTSGSAKAPEFDIKVIPLDRVFDHLPSGTARIDRAERLQRLRKRQIGWQQRQLW